MAIFFLLFCVLFLSSTWTIEGAIREPNKKNGGKDKEDALSVELKRLEQEKREAEQQMKVLEEEHRKKLDDIEAAAKLAAEVSISSIANRICILK